MIIFCLIHSQVSIAGGMISEVDGMIDSAFVNVLRSDGFHDADANDKDSVEDRIIAASLKMIRKSKKKTAELTEQVMDQTTLVSSFCLSKV